MKVTITLNLALQAVKQIALKFGDFAATQARHMYVIALRPSLVEVLLALHVHQVQLIYQPVTFKEIQCSVNGHAVNSRVPLAGMAKNLTRVQMLLRCFHHT